MDSVYKYIHIYTYSPIQHTLKNNKTILQQQQYTTSPALIASRFKNELFRFTRSSATQFC